MLSNVCSDRLSAAGESLTLLGLTKARGSAAVLLTDCGPERPSCVPHCAGSHCRCAAIFCRCNRFLGATHLLHHRWRWRIVSSTLSSMPLTMLRVIQRAGRAVGKAVFPSLMARGVAGTQGVLAALPLAVPEQDLKCAACCRGGRPPDRAGLARVAGVVEKPVAAFVCGAGGRSALWFRLWIDA